MAALQHQPEGQDGGYESAQPTYEALPSEPFGQDLNPIECNVCEKRFKTKSALNAVSLQVPSREITRPGTDGLWGYYFSTYPTHSRTNLALWIAR